MIDLLKALSLAISLSLRELGAFPESSATRSRGGLTSRNSTGDGDEALLRERYSFFSVSSKILPQGGSGLSVLFARVSAVAGLSPLTKVKAV